MLVKKKKVTGTPVKVEAVPRFENNKELFDNSFAAELINSPDTVKDNPLDGIPAELLNDAYNNQGCPIFYGFNGTVKPVPTPFNIVLEDVSKHTLLYSAIKDKIFENIKLSRSSKNPHTITLDDIEHNITNVVISEFENAYNNLLISYLVDKFKKLFGDIKPEESYDFDYFSTIISSLVTNGGIRFNYNNNIRSLVNKWMELRINPNIPAVQKQNIMLFNICQVRDGLSVDIANLLSDLIRNIMYGVGVAVNNSNDRYTFAFMKKKFTEIYARFKYKTDIDSESACYFVLNTFCAELLRDVTNCIEILLFQTISTLDYLVTDDVAEGIRRTNYHYGCGRYDDYDD